MFPEFSQALSLFISLSRSYFEQTKYPTSCTQKAGNENKNNRESSFIMQNDVHELTTDEFNDYYSELLSLLRVERFSLGASFAI